MIIKWKKVKTNVANVELNWDLGIGYNVKLGKFFIQLRLKGNDNLDIGYMKLENAYNFLINIDNLIDILSSKSYQIDYKCNSYFIITKFYKKLNEENIKKEISKFIQDVEESIEKVYLTKKL